MVDKDAHDDGRPQASPDDLLTLLAVARTGKYTSAAQVLGINHTTVSRRIAALEKSLGDHVLASTTDGWELTARGREIIDVAESIEAALRRLSAPEAGSGLTGTVRLTAPEGFCRHWAVPVLADLQATHPGIQVELFAAAQRAGTQRSGIDIEVVVGRPDPARNETAELASYTLGLYVTEAYAQGAPALATVQDIAEHRLVFYVEHATGVEELEAAAQLLPTPTGWFRSNSVSAHVEATKRGCGVGLLPTFLAEAEPELHRVVPEFSYRATYWATARTETLRNPVVREAFTALVEGCRESRP